MKKYILILALILSFNAKADDEITIIAQTDPNDATTKCGDNCNWKLYSNGKLEISGTGDMYGYSVILMDNEHGWTTLAPWGSYSEQISNIKINSGITSVGEHAFYHTTATNVDLPESVKLFGYGAFQYSPFQSISIPENLVYIDGASFHQTAITDLVIPASVIITGPNSFGSAVLENITIEGNLQLNKEALDSNYGVPQSLNNIYCLATNESCNALKTDTDIGDKITSFTKQAGVYRLEGGTMFATPNDMMNGTNACIDLDSCKAQVLKNKGYCSSDESCMAMVDLENANAPIEYKNKSYASVDDLLKGKYMPKRIYTLEEANTVAGEKNRVSIKYR